MSPPKPPLGPPNDPFTDPLSGSEAQTLSAGDNFTPLSNEMTNQNADIGIGKPPPDASYYDYNDGGSNHHQVLHRVGAQHRDRIDLLGYLHGAQLGGVGGGHLARQKAGGEQWRNLPGQANGPDAAHR